MAALAMSTISGPFPENFHWRSALELETTDVQEGAITEAPAHAHFDGEGHGRPFRTCVATLNNPSLAEAEEIEALTRTTSMSHIVCGFEVGAAGTPHLQLTFTNDKPQRWTWWKNFFQANGQERLWFKPAIAPGPARKYCEKGGFFFTRKDAPTVGQGTRTDITELVSFTIDVAAGKRTYAAAFNGDYPDLSESLPNSLFRYSSHFSRSLQLLVVPTPRAHWTHGVWLHGPPGTGKTSWVLQAFPDAEFITWTTSGFMNGYTGQSKVVVMDDEDVQNLTPSLLKKLINKTKVTINTKNCGRMWWNPEVFIIISNYEITDMPWYTADAPSTDQHGFTAVQARFEPHRHGYTQIFNNFTVPHDCPDWLVGAGPAAGEQLPPEVEEDN